MPKIAILTFCVGADYKRAMEPGLASKRAYAERHGYDFLTDGEDVWDRSRPIPWSKLRFLLKYLDAYDYLFWSDADAIFLDPSKSLEAHVLPLLPAHKDMLWTWDACNHYNNGHVLLRGKSAWARSYLTRAYEQTDLIHHIWWDNAAMIRLYETIESDRARIETCTEHWLLNAYVFGPTDSAQDPSTRLYRPGDFLIHFAGVYDCWNIYRMMKYMLAMSQTGRSYDPALLDTWRSNPPFDQASAEQSLQLALFSRTP